MKLSAKIVNTMIHWSIKQMCTIDNKEINKIQAKGPLIIVINHINFLDAPLMRLELLPRDVAGMAKKETWDNWFFAFLGNLWGGIPIDRNTTDFKAFRLVLDVLKQNNILCLAPEGTRSKNGILQQGLPGVISMASHANVPILPLVHYGTEKFWENLKNMRKTRITFKVGNPFRLIKKEKRITSEMRNKMITEIMYQMASLLPPEYRGYYSDLKGKTENYLDFI